MPRKSTLEAFPYQRPQRPAVGLHCPVRKKPYFFANFKTWRGQPKQTLTIGRQLGSDIRLADDYVSSRHALIKRQSDGSVQLLPDSPKNGLYVDGSLITEPIVLIVGMRLRLGQSRLIAINEHGRFKYSAEDYDDYLIRGGEYYGSNALAGEKIGRSHETIRKRRAKQEPRTATCRTRRTRRKNRTVS